MNQDGQQWIDLLKNKKELNKGEQQIIWKHILNHDLAMLAVHKTIEKEVKATLLRKGCAAIGMKGNFIEGELSGKENEPDEIFLLIINLLDKPHFNKELLSLSKHNRLFEITIKLKEEDTFHTCSKKHTVSDIGKLCDVNFHLFNSEKFRNRFFQSISDYPFQVFHFKHAERMGRWAISLYAKQFEQQYNEFT